MSRKNITVVVKAVRQLTDKINEYVLASASGEMLPEVEPGSHIRLHTGEKGLIIRHYSIVGGLSNFDDSKDNYRIAVQLEELGRGGSQFIHQSLNVGSTLEISPPINNFPLLRADKHSILIAGGIGITPIFSMARSLNRRNKSFDVIYVGRERHLMAYVDEIEKLEKAGILIHESGATNSRPLDFEQTLTSYPKESTIYICGPKPMIDAVKNAALKIGFSESQIQTELFGVGMMGDEQPFELHLSKSKQRLTIPKDASILDVLQANDIPVLWDCRRGECGLCVQNVISTDTKISHQDYYLSEEERLENHQICICVSRSKGETLELDL